MTEVGPGSRRRWRIRGILIVLVVIGIGSFFATIRSGRGPDRPRIPSPNGYDDLVRAGAQIEGTWPNKGDFAKAKLEDLRPFIELNRANLELARVGLARECLAVIEDSQEGLSEHFDRFGKVRNAARLVQGEGILFELQGRPVEASRSYRDLLEVGQAMTQGGLGNDVTAGFVYQRVAIGKIGGIVDKLPTKTILELISHLDSLERRRLSPDAIEARRVRWVRGAFTPFQRTILDWNGMAQQGQLAEQSMIRAAMAKVEMPMRYLQIQLAIHAFHNDKNAWPRSIQELVPDYLPKAPIDPETGQPVEYPANAMGELTDDLSAIARPDGQVKPQPQP